MTDITTEAGKRLREDIREMAQVIHQTDSLRSHADPNDKTGWNLGPIETCEDPYCVDGRDASDAIAAIEAEAWEKGYGDGVIEAQRREVESIPDYRAKAIADERARVRERLTSRLAPSEAAAVLAILEDEA